MGIITFDDSSLTSLMFLDYGQTWTFVGYEQLEEDEQVLISRFLGYLPQIEEEINLDKLLLVKADEHHALDRVYGPTIYRREKNIILKVGDNEFPVKQDGNELVCGELRGSIDFDGDERSVKIKKDGKEEQYKVQNCFVSFVVMTEGATDNNIYQCAIRTAPESNPIKASVIVALRQKKNVAQFFAEPAAQGTGAVKMRDMAEGVYKLVGSEPYVGDYDPTHIIETEDGVKFWAQGMIKKALDSGKQIPDHFNELTITSKDKSADGSKTYVNMKLRLNKGKVAPVVEKPATEEIDMADIPF